MKCSELMKADVESVTLTDPVFVAAQKMRAKNVGFLPVCDSSLNILGTITDRDIAVRVVADRSPPNIEVWEMMSKEEPVTCRDVDNVHVAERLMAQHHKSRIMCVDVLGKLKGVISLSDTAQHERSNKRVRRTVAEVCLRETRG